MGITMRQQINTIADAYEQKELRILDLQSALLTSIVDAACGAPCPAYKTHPAPWHTSACACALEARKRCLEARNVREAKEQKP